MVKIFFHTRDVGSYDWQNVGVEMATVPRVGETVALNAVEPEGWHHRVYFVVHCAFEAEVQAEVYAIRVNHLDAMHDAERAAGLRGSDD